MIRCWKYIELFLIGFMPSVLYCEMSQEDKIRSLLFRDPVTEEETSSLHMPDNYMCDACLGVTHCLEKIFERIDERHTKRKLTESSIVDAVDNLCRNVELWHEYGLKEVDGKKRLTGPGLEADTLFGMTMDGKFWPLRMMEFCWKLIGETEDVELYKIFKGGKLNKTLCYGGEKSYCKEQKKTEL